MITLTSSLTITIEIHCLPNLVLGDSRLPGYVINILICKWIYNGVEYYDNYTTAISDCGLVYSGYTLIGLDNGYISDSSATKYPLVKSYLNSAACGK
jgi:hypothetical protein